MAQTVRTVRRRVSRCNELEIPQVFGGGAVQTQDRHVLEAFAAAGLDADTFGFDYLPDRTERLRDVVSRSRFAWVSANVRDGSYPDQAFAAAQGARLWLLKTVGGVQVGITGLVAPGYTAGSSELAAQPTPAVTVLDPVTALREVVLSTGAEARSFMHQTCSTCLAWP